MGGNKSKSPAEVDADEFTGGITYEKKNTPKENSCFLNETLSDFIVIVKHNSGTWRFPCHKFVLRRDNSLLAISCENADSKEMTITNVDPQVMEIVLRYIYEKEILLEDWKIAFEVLEAAHHYMIEALRHYSEMFLIRSLTLRNVCYILSKSDSLSLSKLKEQCLELCNYAGFIVCQTKAFMLLPEKLVREILESNDVNIRGEYSVFLSLWNWSKLQCIRKTLSLTEINIITEFSNVADCVRFESIGENQKKFLPELIKSKYLENKRETSSKVSTRYVKFPLNLPKDFYCSLIFDSKEKGQVNIDPVIGSFVTCIKFCVKPDAYIVNLSTLCLKKDSCSTPVKELKLSSAEGIVFSWSTGNEIFVKQVSSEKHVFSVSDLTNVIETEFHAVRPLPLYTDLVYTLEITPFENGLQWPRVVPIIERRKSDLAFDLCASLCCGLKSITFLQAK